jgi:hypothetical protein
MLDAPIANKIQTMNQRVRWRRHPLMIERGIAQTALVLEDGQAGSPELSPPRLDCCLAICFGIMAWSRP